jgi:hypothetical protein
MTQPEDGMPQLSGEEQEWLVRAAVGPPSGFIPPAVVSTLVAAGLGERNLHGTFDVSAAGRRYLTEKNLLAAGRKHPR